MHGGAGEGANRATGVTRDLRESHQRQKTRENVPQANGREKSLMTLCGRHATGKPKTKIAATASSRPTVANDAANGHLCDIYDIYIYQWYWGISELLVWFTQQGENNFQGRNLLWKLLIRHICVCEQQSLPHATRKVPHNSEFIVFTTAFLFSHFFLPGSQQFLTVQTRERQTWCAGLVSTMTCLRVCVRVCAWPFGFQSTLEWHSNQLHISMFKWANMQQRAECRERHSFMLHLHNSNLLACTWLKFHLSHLLALLPLRCCRFSACYFMAN